MATTNNDEFILKKTIGQKKAEIAPSLTDNRYFEIFTAEQILKGYDPSYEEIQSGIVAGGDDGGIDSIYLFINGELVKEDTDLSSYKKNVIVELHFIQSKFTSSFSESTIIKLDSSAKELLNFSNNINQLTHYNSQLLGVIGNFRKAYEELASKFPDFQVWFYYATSGDTQNIHPKVSKKVESLNETVNSLFSNAKFNFKFLGAKELLSLARQSPSKSFSINLTESPISSGNEGYICLVNLRDYFKFITDENKKLRRNIFEANVRDYQGSNQVNEAIQKTLTNNKKEEFWWLNNGITIVAEKASITSKIITIENPQIVNGLQTSYEIQKHFADRNEQDERNILLRIIVPRSIEIWDQIIFATNSQTQIPLASLRATEKIHRDIEDFFKTYELYYDRRKNYYKNDGKPLEKIISIPFLAQSVMSIALQQPDNARARPSSLLKKDEDYLNVFNPDYPIKTYLICAQIMRAVEGFFKFEEHALAPKDKTNLKHYLGMYASIVLTKKKTPSPADLERIDLGTIDFDIMYDLLSEGLCFVKGIFEELGQSDQVAKGPIFKEKIIKSVDIDW